MQRAERGFTLVELMVVVALIAILAGVAVSYSGENRATVRGVAGQIVGECDQTRMRALSSRRWHRLRFDVVAGKMIVEQAATTGMVKPADADEWLQVGAATLPKVVALFGIAPSANLDPGEGIPADGDGLDLALEFGPDGAAEPRTVYLQSYQGRDPFRVVVYRATGTATARSEW